MSNRPTSEQFSLLLDYMEEHPKLLAGTVDPTFNIHQHRKCWEEISNILKSSGVGSIKTSQKWKKTWADWKCCVRSKAAALKRRTTATGGGPPAKPLSDVEERLIGLIGWTRVTGLQAVPEGGINEDEPLPKRRSTEENGDVAEMLMSHPDFSEVAESVIVTPLQPASNDIETPSCSTSQSARGQSRVRRRSEQQNSGMAAASVLADIQRQKIEQSARLADAMERVAAAHVELAAAVKQQTTEVCGILCEFSAVQQSYCAVLNRFADIADRCTGQ